MNWEQLLSLKRAGDIQKRPRAAQDETRLGFDVDFDRIIFSSAFRSLQDKTQVIPLSQTDFVHTRLTHSLEVSVVGRTLGRKVGKVLLERHPNLAQLGYTFNDFGAIVAAASVMHDIGNPPFGHSGEKAIGEYFKSGEGVKYKAQLTAKEYQDLIDFEGNANGFKILTATKDGVPGGLRLSYATLGAFLKYPKESLPKKPTKHVVDKKYGVFQSETAAPPACVWPPLPRRFSPPRDSTTPPSRTTRERRCRACVDTPAPSSLARSPRSRRSNSAARSSRHRAACRPIHSRT